MKTNTKYFGAVEYQPEEEIHFSEGLFGFEEQKSFLPIPLEADSDVLLCLQSLESKELCFIVMNPFHFFAGYNPQISAEDRKAIGSPKDEDISYYAIGVFREQLSDSTVNLKAPIAVNCKTRKARQIILEDPTYTFRHSLGELQGGEE